ncbi:MAG: hypothetical protein AAGF27_01260 [Pseudomonadota bacterium]
MPNGNRTSASRLQISLFGSFSIRDSNGQSVLPKGSKTRALIATLATSQDLSRPRAWVQDILWSTRGQEQRAASLRQSLAELRRGWADYPGVINADRQRIWLDPAQTEILAHQEGIFLEDLSVRDPAFIAWLGLQRLHRADTQLPNLAEARGDASDDPFRKRRIAIACDPALDSATVNLVSTAHDVLNKALYETGTVDLVRSGALDRVRLDRLISIVSTRSGDETIQLRCVIEAPSSSRVIWTGQCAVVGSSVEPAVNAQLLSFCNQVAEAACQSGVALQAGAVKPDAQEHPDLTSRISLAVSSIFSIRSDLLSSAVNTLEGLLADRPQPILYGWLAQAYTIQYVERYRPADAELRERCEAACREALAGGAQNSNVLAAVANARTNISQNYLAGLQLAEQSVRLNAANPLAWWAHSNALQCVGRSELAYRAARNAQVLAETTQLQFWTDFQVSVTAALLGQTDVAIQNGERSVALVPDFRPPLRYLTALYAMGGDLDGLSRSASALKSVELDFDITQMIEDKDYPIGMMRRYGQNLTRALRDASRDTGLL